MFLKFNAYNTNAHPHTHGTHALTHTHACTHQTRKLISTQKTSHKHNSKDPSRLRYLSSGMRVNTRYVNSIRMYLWWSLCTLNLLACQVRVTVSAENYRRRLRSLLLCLCEIFRALIHSLVC